MAFFIVACVSFIASFGLINYISAIVTMKVKQTGSCPYKLRNRAQLGITSALFLPLVVLCIGGVIGIFNPVIIYKTMHYMWILGLVALLLTVTIIRAIFLIKSKSTVIRTRKIAKKPIIITLAIVGWIVINLILVSPIPDKIEDYFFEEFIIVVVILAVIIVTSVLTVILLKKLPIPTSLVQEKATSRGVMLIAGCVITLGVFVFSIVNVGNTVVKISTADDFILLKNLPVAGKTNYIVTNDIDFNGTYPEGWGEIEDFSGVFDGGHHSFRNLNFTYTDEDEAVTIGMVGNNLGEIKNLSVENSYFDVDLKSNLTTFYFGVLAAKQGAMYEDGVINNCRLINVYADIDIFTTTSYFNGYVGGFVGENWANISNCEIFTNNEIKNNGLFIDFDVESQTESCRMYVDLGGFAGSNNSGSFNHCIIKGLPLDAKVLGSYNYVSVGGLIGDNDGTHEIANCILDVNSFASADRSYFWAKLQMGEIETYPALLIGEQNYSQYNKITSRDNYIVQYPNLKLVGNGNEDSIPGMVLIDSNDILLGLLPISYSEWIVTTRGYPTPCKGFVN